MLFTELPLDKDLLEGIADAKFTSCMPVQERTFLETLEKRDVYVQSQTGSGKTAAFLITIFEHFRRNTFARNRAVIIVPTRELAVQIEEEAQVLGGRMPYRIGSFFGGVGYEEQLDLLEQDVEIIVGTPGRLIDLADRRKLDFRDTSILVIDEADRLFDMGFIPDLRKMLNKMPKREERLTMLFSATLSARVWQLAWEHMNDPVQIVLNPENITVSEVNQELYHVSNDVKFRLLLGILAREKAANVLIFTNTKQGAVTVSKRLEYNGYQSQFIIGDLPQKKRLKLIEQMKAGELQVLVATDVAARGLHINDLPLVVNYDVPEDPEGYVHRIGRTARAGNTGKAITLACERFVYGLESIEELIDSKIPVVSTDDALLTVEDASAGRHIDTRHEGTRDDSRGRSDRRPSDRRGTGGRSPVRRSPGRASDDGESRRNRPAAASGGGKPRQPAPPAGAANAGAANAGAGRPPRPDAPRPDGRPDHSRRDRSSNRGPRPTEAPKPVSADTSIQDRLEHYRKKYGEDFKLVGSPESGKQPRRRKPDRATENAAESAAPREISAKAPSSPPMRPAPEPATPSEKPKPSILRRLFGRRKDA